MSKLKNHPFGTLGQGEFSWKNGQMYTKREYINGIVSLKHPLTERQKAILRALYKHRHCLPTITDVAQDVPCGPTKFALDYGLLGKKIALSIGRNPPKRDDDSYVFWTVLCVRTGYNTKKSWIVVMQPALAEALEEIGLVSIGDSNSENTVSEIEMDCDAIFCTLSFEIDVRKAPDNKRKGNFAYGWKDAAERGRTYSEASLKRLTWHNLGYRLGQVYGIKPLNVIEESYVAFAQRYEFRHESPDEVVSPTIYVEGATRQIMVNAYERN